MTAEPVIKRMEDGSVVVQWPDPIAHSYPVSVGVIQQFADTHNEAVALRRWKDEAVVVLAAWEAVWEAAGRPGRLGQSKAASVKALFDAPEVVTGVVCGSPLTSASSSPEAPTPVTTNEGQQ